MISANDLRPGKAFKWDGVLYKCTEYQHVKPGKGPAFVRVKIMNLETGSNVEHTLKPELKFEELRVERRPATFLYPSGDNYVFMDAEDYEQHEIPGDLLGKQREFLTENMEVSLIHADGRIIDVELPLNFVTTITYTEPGIKGDTATGATKPAQVEGGATINVPLFINIGDKVKVDTREGKYLERVRD
ncbi:MAG TPA: elongation factor P [bacterium]|nr:elongation factor P [bacterium]